MSSLMRARQKKRKKSNSRTGYFLGALVLVIVIAVGWYAFASQAPSIVYAKLNTTQGLIEVELYQSKTPKTVTNFVNLAKSGFYNNLVWHRIAQGFVIQTGDPDTRDGGGDRSHWGEHGSLQTIPLEPDSSLHNNVGYLAMARVGDDLNSGTSQFFINLANNNRLDGTYTVFGKVINPSGMEAANAIGNLQVDTPPDGKPLDPLPFLLSVTISNSQ